MESLKKGCPQQGYPIRSPNPERGILGLLSTKQRHSGKRSRRESEQLRTGVQRGYMQLKNCTATEKSKRQTLQKLKRRAATENTKGLEAVYKRLEAGKILEDAAKSREAAQSRQAAM
jgi:hypothetical protein